MQMKQMPQDAYMQDMGGDDGSGLVKDGTEAEREPGGGAGPARGRNEF